MICRVQKKTGQTALMTPKALVFFDVDGTLVPATSSSQHLAGFLGHLAALRKAEDAYARGEISNQDVSVLDARGWSGQLPADIDNYLQALPLIGGLADVAEWARQREVLPYLATLAWRPVGEYPCAKYGFAGCCGPSVVISDGRYTGDVAQHLDEFGKRDYARSVAASHGLDLRSCAAVGDSRSDGPLFHEVGFSVAFNASDALKEMATTCRDGETLSGVLDDLSGWLRTLSS